MSFDKNSIGNTFKVAVGLSLVCSIVVSIFAVGLRPIQSANAERFRKQNILEAARYLISEDGDLNLAGGIDSLYSKHVTARFVNLETGETSEEFPLADESFTLDSYDLEAASKDPALIEPVEGRNIAGLQGAKREKVSLVYEVRVDDELQGYVLPIRGYGLWSTLWGFIALESDTRTIRGLTFYQHKETPGLGGEVDNSRWKAQWNGKHVYDADGDVAIEVVKGTADGETEVDGLAGATITSRGVTNMLEYWLGSRGFGPFLARARGEDPTVPEEGDDG